MLIEQRILDLQKDKGALIDKVRDLENKVARLINENKMLKEGKTNVFAELNEETAESNAMLMDKVRDLEQQIEKMKCCENCKHYNPCVTVNETITNLCEDYYNGCNNSIYEPFNKWEIKEK